MDPALSIIPRIHGLCPLHHSMDPWILPSPTFHGSMDPTLSTHMDPLILPSLSRRIHGFCPLHPHGSMDPTLSLIPRIYRSHPTAHPPPGPSERLAEDGPGIWDEQEELGYPQWRIPKGSTYFRISAARIHPGFQHRFRNLGKNGMQEWDQEAPASPEGLVLLWDAFQPFGKELGMSSLPKSHMECVPDPQTPIPPRMVGGGRTPNSPPLMLWDSVEFLSPRFLRVGRGSGSGTGDTEQDPNPALGLGIPGKGSGALTGPGSAGG